jgi:K+-transporting ATPase ATPase C chain
MNETLGRSLGVALRTTGLCFVLTGLLYPLLITAAAQLFFPVQANGSRVEDATGKVVGSRLIGQSFVQAAYFESRPSAAGTGYDGLASGGSNLGPTSGLLRARVEARATALRRENPQAPGPVPAELVTTSASGLDPHLSPDAIAWQIPRVARARGLSPERVEALVASLVEPRVLGILGEPRVNVLGLNLALDRQFGAPVP